MSWGHSTKVFEKLGSVRGLSCKSDPESRLKARFGAGFLALADLQSVHQDVNSKSDFYPEATALFKQILIMLIQGQTTRAGA